MIMKKLLLLFIVFSFSLQAQIENFNGYSFATIIPVEYKSGETDPYGIEKATREYLSDIGFPVVSINSSNGKAYVNGKEWQPKEVCNILFFQVYPKKSSESIVILEALNCKQELVYRISGQGINWISNYSDNYQRAVKNIFKKLKSFKYSYDKSLATSPPTPPKAKERLINENFDINDERSVRKYLDAQRLESIEGIWNYLSADDTEYKLLILKDDYLYKAYILESNNDYVWSLGDLKAVFEPAAVNTVLTLNWIMGNKVTEEKSIATLDTGVIKFSLGDEDEEVILYKVYPQLRSVNPSTQQNTSEWSSTGSGIIISSSGHIVTNYHVIEGADKVEVEFVENGESKSFNAEVVLSDKVNDLSLLKIFDMNFNSIEEPPYNFQSRSVDVGTSVYAFGYPMALSLMGKELKVTDGIISAKSGFQGNITTYQISAPIQPGNSGGPLFDGKGNLIGINSSGVRKDVVENVGYTIKSSYLVNLLDALPYTIVLPRNTSLENLPLPEQIKALSKYVVLIKVK